MENAGLVALSRQMSLFRQMDVIANNIANANTNGYKAENTMFEEFIKNSAEVGGESVSFTRDIATVRDLKQGDIKPTSRQLDVAIEGEGYFTIETPLGIRYTRVGSFQINQEGNLVTQQGYNVLGEGNSPIIFGEEDREVTFGENGLIKTRVPGGREEQRGILNIVKFDNQQELKKTANMLFVTEQAPSPAIMREDFSLIQGMLEESNVNSTQQLTQMIKVSRAVASTSKFMNELHDMQRKAISIISKQN